MARLAAGLWVAAYLQRLAQAGVFAHVAARGDPTAGAVVVKLATMDGRAVARQRSYDPLSGERVWAVLAEGAEADVDAALKRSRRRDPDLWLIEIEDPRGRDLLDEPGLE
jgi:hypothetical protein